MSRKVAIAVFLALCVAQLAAAVSMIVRHETALTRGTPFKIKVVPADPADPFRGRYLAVRAVLIAPVPEGPGAADQRRRLDSWGETVFVTLETGPDGFARVVRTSTEPPTGSDWLEARTAGNVYVPAPVREQTTDEVAPGEEGRPSPPGGGRLTGFSLDLPFDRYYLEEPLAPEAEAAYREATSAGPTGAEAEAWIVARVWNGMGVIESLWVRGVRVEEAARGRREAGPRQ